MAVYDLTNDDWEAIIKALKSSQCVPFLGAGASLNFEGPGLPTASALAKDLAQESDYQGADKGDFLRVCQFYEMKYGRQVLRLEISKRLSVRGVTPGKVHRILAKLPVTHVLTTNYDRLMERAFENEGKKPEVRFYDILAGGAGDVPTATVEQPVVYKMHGTMDRETSMICTEDDVVQFLARIFREEPGLPRPIKELFEKRSFLFIGYGLRDWNVRVLIRALRFNNPSDWIKSFAVQRRPGPPFGADFDAAVTYFGRRESISVFDRDASDFMDELDQRYNMPPGSAPPPIGGAAVHHGAVA
jgi:hypothetical protein